MDNEQLVKFCSEIVKLKQQLKCPICLDIIQENAELQCGHKLCSFCYKTHKGNTNNQVNSCPICKTTISRRSSVYKDDFANKFGCLVTNICNIIEKAKNSTIEEVIHYDGQPLIRKTYNSSTKYKSGKYKSNLQKFETTEDKTSKKVKGQIDPEYGNKTNIPVCNNEPSTTQEDAFDNLRSTPQEFTVNKKGSRVKYKRKKKEKEEYTDYKILEFDKSSTKAAVLEWLNDNKNKFDRLTQTQCFTEDFKEIPTIDLTSVSQVPPIESKTSRRTVSRTKRTRSLDPEINKPPKDIKRLSDTGLMENYSIDEINSEDVVLKKAEENVLLKMIEDEYLNKIEKDLLGVKSKNKQKEQQTTQSSSSGWERIEKISKTIGGKRKSPRKLDITLQTSQNNTAIKKSSRSYKKQNKGANITTKSEGESYDKSFTNHSVDESICKDDSIKKLSKKEKGISTNSQNSEKENNQSLVNVSNEQPKVKVLSDVIVHQSMVDDKERSSNTNQDNKKDHLNNNIYAGAKEQVNTGELVKEIDPYILPTQKIEDTFPEISNIDCAEQSSSILEVSFQSDLHNSFSDVMKELQSNLDNYKKNIDNNKHLRKRDIENIQKYLKKLNDLHELNVQKETAEIALQTDYYFCHADTQTERVEYCEIRVQTSGICCENYNNTSETHATQSKKTDQSIGSKTIKSLKSLPNDDFGSTLDLVNFETQDIVNQYSRNNENRSSEKSDEQKAMVTDHPVTNQDPPFSTDGPNVLVCSLKSDNDKKNNEENASFKRALSDSDSSDIVLPKRRCNRFIRDDLSIEFDATEKQETQKKGLSAGLSPETDGENDEEYLNKILKKYENGREEDSSDDILSSRREDRNTDDVCDNMVAQVSENVEKLAKLNVSSKSTYKTANVLDDDNLFLQDEDFARLDGEISFHANQNKEQSENSDIIGETECSEPHPKKMRLRSSNKGCGNEKLSAKSLDKLIEGDTNLPSPIKPKETFCEELEDSLNDADFENIQIDEEIKKNTIPNENRSHMNEEDLFSDEDIVETTPQKDKGFTDRRSQLSAVNLSSRFSLGNQDFAINDVIDFDFVPLAPPPGFEDDNNVTTVDEDITLVNLERSKKDDETPKKLLPTKSRMDFPCLTPKALNISVQKVMHSTPLTQVNTLTETLGFSPIVHEKSIFDKSSIDKDKTIVPISTTETPKKSNILTSDPKQKSILNYVRTSQGSNPDAAKQKPCIACTRLDKSQKQNISLLVSKKLATYSAKFDDSVTHMIVSVDKNKKIKDYTMKIVSAVAAGIWILEFEWIQECLKKNAIVSEEPYEALDDTGSSGPKAARLSRNKRSFFQGFRFYCHRPLYSATADEVEDVITKLGGEAVRNMESLVGNKGKICLIITEGRSTQEVYERWLEKYKIAAVDIEWLSKSIGQYKILSVRPYTWCSDNTLDDLGYPPYLTEDTSASCSSSEPI